MNTITYRKQDDQSMPDNTYATSPLQDSLSGSRIIVPVRERVIMILGVG